MAEFHCHRGRAASPSPEDQFPFKVYWESCDDRRLESRHRTRKAAEKACAKLNTAFEKHNPTSGGVSYLCGYAVRPQEDE